MKTELPIQSPILHATTPKAVPPHMDARPSKAAAIPVSAPIAPEPAKQAMVQADLKAMNARIHDAIKSLNEQMRQQSRNLSFSYDEVVDNPVIVVKASDTGQVIRQIPDVTFLKVAHSIEAMKGLIKDHLS